MLLYKQHIVYCGVVLNESKAGESVLGTSQHKELLKALTKMVILIAAGRHGPEELHWNDLAAAQSTLYWS